jgi:Uma2 family endonuclease
MAVAAPSFSSAEHPGSVAIVTPLASLPLRVRLARPLDDDELLAFCAKNRELRIERTKDGELIIMPPTGSETGRKNFALIGKLAVWVERDGTGVGFDSSTGFILPNGAERAPDAAWVKKERWFALSEEQRQKFAPLCPDFVVELRSPTDTLAELCDKLEEYIESGARLGWLIDPFERRVHVYQPGRPPEVLADPGEVAGDPVLPGFVLPLDVIWG